MVKSMTGFSKSEAKEKGISVTTELKSLNGRYLEINCRTPKSLSQKELEIREMVKKTLARGSVQLNVSVDYEGVVKPFKLDEQAALECYRALTSLKQKTKIRDEVRLDHLLKFSDSFYQTTNEDTSEAEWNLVKRALSESLRELDKMRQKEGQQILKDIQARLKKIQTSVEKIESLGIKRVPLERDKLRQRIAQLFDSDEIDEQRIQMEIVLIANKLDTSDECVRLRSHLKFMFETFKANEPIGQKINFLLQEMNREINTIGSKSDDAEISQTVVGVKEELERIREQAANIE